MQLPTHADHDRHDQTLIAGLDAGDLSDLDRQRAQSLLSSCGACSDLHVDLVAIRAAIRVLPPAQRTRDFRLTPDQAASLRRGSWLRGLLRPFSGAQSSLRPMAAAFSSLGIAGLLVASLAPALLGSAASSPTERDSVAAGAGSPSSTIAPAFAPAPTGEGLGAAQASGPPAPQAGGDASIDPDDGKSNVDQSDDPRVAVGGVSSPESEDLSAEDTGQPAERQTDLAPPGFLVIGSLGFLIVGIGLFGLRFAARRLR